MKRVDLSEILGEPGAYLSYDLESHMVYLNVHPVAEYKRTEIHSGFNIDYTKSGRVIGVELFL